MAKLNMERVLEHLDTDIRIAMEHALRRADPNNTVDAALLTHCFMAALRERCDDWQAVPDWAVRPAS